MLFYPFFIAIFNFYALIVSMKNIICVLLKGKDWKYYSGNTAHTAINNYFYYTQDLNVQKFGRFGNSKLLAGGDYSLAKLFQLNPLSLRLMSSLGTTCMLVIAMCVWLFSVTFLTNCSSTHQISLIFVIISSSLFFANFIDLQNYNILGWMLLPFAFYSMLHHSYYAFFAASFLMSFMSFTSIFFLGFYVIVFVLWRGDIYLLVSFFPAVIRFIIPMLISIRHAGVYGMTCLLGLIKTGAKYRRSDVGVSLVGIYLLTLFGSFSIGYFMFFGLDNYSILMFSFVFLFALNSFFSRFADTQSLFIVFLTISSMAILSAHHKHFLILEIMFYFSINPAYFLIGLKPFHKGLFSPLPRTPVSMKLCLEQITNMFREVKPGSKILMTFSNPNNEYGKIFDGFRQYIEPIEYVANKYDICVFPDWYFIEKNNCLDSSDDFWGVSQSQIVATMSKYSAEYVIRYREYGDIVKFSLYKNYYNLLGSIEFSLMPGNLFAIT